MLSSMWPPAGTTLVLSFKDHLLEDIKDTKRGEVEAGCSDMLKCWLRGEWPREGGMELVHCVWAVQRCLRQESAWSTAAHCRQLSECLVPSVVPQQEEVWGIGWSYCCPYIRCLSLLLMTPPP